MRWGLSKSTVHVTFSRILGMIFGINIAAGSHYESRMRVVRKRRQGDADRRGQPL